MFIIEIILRSSFIKIKYFKFTITENSITLVSFKIQVDRFGVGEQDLNVVVSVVAGVLVVEAEAMHDLMHHGASVEAVFAQANHIDTLGEAYAARAVAFVHKQNVIWLKIARHKLNA